ALQNMVLNTRIWYFFVLIALLIGSAPQTIAQQNTDLTTVKVDELTDDQVTELVKRASEAGLGTDEFLQMAQLRGMPSSEVEKLRVRIQNLDTSGSTSRITNASKREPRQQLNMNEITQGLYQPQEDV